MDKEDFPKLEIMPIIDRIVNAALWVGHLFTRQVVHDPAQHYDVYNLQEDVDKGWSGDDAA